MKVIVIENLTKVFRSGFLGKPITVLKGISLTVEKGEIFGFIGPNGAGKTTTIKIIMDILRPTSGRVSIFGKPPSDISWRSKVGFLPENPYFYDYLKARELLYFYGKLLSMNKDYLIERIDFLLDLVGLKGIENVFLRNYSKGMLQRIGIAQALLADPELLILDEPMSGLDPVGRVEIKDLLLKLKKLGKTIFFSTHILSDAEMLCDRVAIIASGEIKKLGRLDELLFEKSISTEIIAEGLKDASFIHALGGNFEIKKENDRWIFTTIDEKLAKEIVRGIISHGGRLIFFGKQRMKLEEVFIEAINES